MKLRSVSAPAARVTALISVTGLSAAVAVVGVNSFAHSMGATRIAIPAHATGRLAESTANLNGIEAAGAIGANAADRQLTAYPATFISHMAVGPVIVQASWAQSFLVNLGVLVPTATEVGGQGQADQLIAC
ncbi:hypothetical protein GCM10009839_69420 [Catenulispora yoronensis]|uniref:Uncharacterized protein n=1 Tax=Catenulispora yoronensis TaxID=450799 RepID=A0ABN2V559_9ACTN